MSRPKVPLISRRKVIATSLVILENEGVDALTVRRIAQELTVNAASLYHHFSSKEEILAATARAALAEMYVPEFDGGDWINWCAEIALEHRRFLMKRPYMVQLIVQRTLPRTTLPVVVIHEKELARNAVARAEDRAYILDSVEALIIGSALMMRNTLPRPGMSAAKVRIEMEQEERVFIDMVKALLDGLLRHFAAAKRVEQ